MKKMEKSTLNTYKIRGNYFIDIVSIDGLYYEGWIWKKGCRFKLLMIQDIIPSSAEEMKKEMEDYLEESIDDYEMRLEEWPPLVELDDEEE